MKKSIIMFALAGMALAAADGSALYQKCAACHGAQGEKHALGKSKIINTMKPSEIETALKGYKNGTYGGTMKAVMKGQAAGLDDSQIAAIAEYIGSK